MPAELLTPEQVVEQRILPFGNANWVRQQLRTGKLRGTKISGRWMTTREAVEDMVSAGANTTATRRRRRRRAVA